MEGVSKMSKTWIITELGIGINYLIDELLWEFYICELNI